MHTQGILLGRKSLLCALSPMLPYAPEIAPWHFIVHCGKMGTPGRECLLGVAILAWIPLTIKGIQCPHNEGGG